MQQAAALAVMVMRDFEPVAKVFVAEKVFAVALVFERVPVPALDSEPVGLVAELVLALVLRLVLRLVEAKPAEQVLVFAPEELAFAELEGFEGFEPEGLVLGLWFLLALDD